MHCFLQVQKVKNSLSPSSKNLKVTILFCDKEGRHKHKLALEKVSGILKDSLHYVKYKLY